MRNIVFVLILGLTSCMPNSDIQVKTRYWYWYKSITYSGSGGTFISNIEYNIGDQIADETGEIIEITSEKHFLNN
jgi:hypothetical protein